jgi:CTP synthase
MASWAEMATQVDNLGDDIHIALIGKYTNLQDSYLSVLKSLKHAGFACKRNVVIDWVEASHLELNETEEKCVDAWSLVKAADGILVPGGFGDRGVEGKIKAINYARVNKVPYLGVCLGMQLAVIEYARNVLGLEGATSAEFDERAKHPLIIFMPEISATHMGGTMRLGSRQTVFREYVGHKSIASVVYGTDDGVFERHRHRYEVNPEYVEQIEENGMMFTGVDDKGQRMEIVELPQDVHPFYLAVQFHPEFQTRPQAPSPPFAGFILAAGGMWEKTSYVANTGRSSPRLSQ